MPVRFRQPRSGPLGQAEHRARRDRPAQALGRCAPRPLRPRGRAACRHDVGRAPGGELPADVERRIVEAFRAGTNLKQIARDLDADDVPTARGARH
jgi:hypothetical protein